MIVPTSSNHLVPCERLRAIRSHADTCVVDFKVAAVYSLLDVIRHFTKIRREMARARDKRKERDSRDV